MILHYGFEQPTPQIMDKWNKWFESLSDRMVEVGGLGDGFELSDSGRKDLPFGKDSITGFNIILAEDLAEAEKLASTNPYVASIRVYEMRSQ